MVELVDDGGTTQLSTVATIGTSATEVIIPPGLLQPGSTHVYLIQAARLPGVDGEAEPNRQVLPRGPSSSATAPATI